MPPSTLKHVGGVESERDRLIGGCQGQAKPHSHLNLRTPPYFDCRRGRHAAAAAVESGCQPSRLVDRPPFPLVLSSPSTSTFRDFVLENKVILLLHPSTTANLGPETSAGRWTLSLLGQPRLATSSSNGDFNLVRLSTSRSRHPARAGESGSLCTGSLSVRGPALELHRTHISPHVQL